MEFATITLFHRGLQNIQFIQKKGSFIQEKHHLVWFKQEVGRGEGKVAALPPPSNQSQVSSSFPPLASYLKSNHVMYYPGEKTGPFHWVGGVGVQNNISC